MSEQQAAIKVEVASVTDRGLSQKRPLNEDSMLVDAERRIFAVADGVGGAQAGEVASQTAVEVLGEAFRHQQEGDDIEDLMEIAIQRANASIYQLSHEQRQLSMMATTLVALHLDGRQATIGHVGDSRLYRLKPDGQLQRETEDHSVVEEEVRAGRMSPEQAANHPSRNVISRALGAEQAVEVDLKTIEVEDGTVFLLCSDGITRHLPDKEINALLRDGKSLEAACEEMKRLCYERGAEDNLTAVVVRVGALTQAASDTTGDDDDRTLLTQRPPQLLAGDRQQIQAADASAMPSQAPLDRTASHDVLSRGATAATNSSSVLRPPTSKMRVDTADTAAAANTAAAQPATAQPERSPTGRAGRWFGVLLLLLTAAAASFYGGIRYQQNQSPAMGAQQTLSNTSNVATPAPTASSELSIFDTYARMKSAVDSAPGAEAQKMLNESGGKPLDSTDPVFLAVYGRALFLSGKHAEAVEALKTANEKIDSQYPPGRNPIRLDTRMTLAAAALRANNSDATRFASESFGNVIEDTGTAGVPDGAATTTPPQ